MPSVVSLRFLRGGDPDPAADDAAGAAFGWRETLRAVFLAWRGAGAGAGGGAASSPESPPSRRSL